MPKDNSNTQKAYIESPLGHIEIMCADDHIISVNFINDKEAGESYGISQTLSECVSQLGEYFQGERQQFDLKLNPKGTDFQKRVWKELLLIPFGKSVSYGDIAARLGDKKAVRAVGTANGSNPIAIIVPCHRVIGQNGSLVGYAAGLERKKWLLQHESPQRQTSLF